MVLIAPKRQGDGIPPYSDGGIYKKPEINDWIIVKDETPKKIEIPEIEAKFWEYLMNNQEFQELSERWKYGTLGTSIAMNKKIAELKAKFLSENPKLAQGNQNNNSIDLFRYGAASQGGIIKLLG